MTDFDQLLQRIREEAGVEGPAGIADLEALRARFDLAVQLIERRRELGFTQVQLASASGIAQAVISRIEQGNANPTMKTIGTLARTLDAKLTLTARAS
jgi:transcriptional regulator with XRE-family HTH domain